MSEVIFVTGIDTDAGKTYATGWLAREWMKKGKKVATMKFIQTGCENVSEDIEVHRKIMGSALPEDQDGITSPIILKYPASAQLAAKLENKSINISLIDQSILQLAKKYDVVIIEGAGGLMVPIEDDYFTIDFILSRDLPVILVTNGVLGSINHTILSLEALKNRGIKVESVIYNSYFDKDKIIAEDTYHFIERYLKREFPETKLIKIEEVSPNP